MNHIPNWLEREKSGNWGASVGSALGTGLEYAGLPFVWLGQTASKIMHPSEWGTMPVGETGWGIASPFFTKEKQGFIEQMKSAIPSGERYEEYQKKPMWEQLAWEAPALLFPVGAIGQAGKAVKPTLKISKTKPLVEATEKVTEKLAKPVEPVADPIVLKLKNLIATHGEATKITKNLRKIELGKRTRIAQEINDRIIRETGDIDKARIASLKIIEGKMPVETVMNPKDLLTKVEFQSMRMKIHDFINPLTKQRLYYFEQINADKALTKLLTEESRLATWEIKLLERVFPGIGEMATLKAQMGGKAFYTVMDVLGIPRALLASGDLSGTLLRQGMILTARFPQLIPGVMKASLKTLFSTKNWRQYESIIKSEMDDMVRANPKIPHLQSATERVYQTMEPAKAGVRLAVREEMYPTSVLYRVPFIKQTIGQFVKASERAFTAPLNYLRWKSAKNYFDMFIKAGTTSEKDLNGIVQLVNAASGRGSLPRAMVGTSPLLNAMFFAPRLVISRFEPLAMIVNPNTSPAVRKAAIRMMVQFMGAGTSILGLAKLAGAEIEMNPKSSDFAKVKIGDTRLDMWAGYVQWARFMAQVTTAERKVTGTGRTAEINRADVIWRILQSKGSPLASIIVDLLQGETFLGEEMFPVTKETTMRELRNRLTPLFAQDLWDAIEIDGLTGIGAAMPGLVGAGVVSYEQRPSGGLPTLPKIKIPSLR